MEKIPQVVKVELGVRSYDIVIGEQLLAKPEVFAAVVAKHSCAVIVSNTTVAPLYAAQLAKTLQGLLPKVLTLVLADGEEYKNWSTLHSIYDFLLQHKCDRKVLLLALGGGVIGDITGFAAASYMRGVDFVQVPTSLLAQVDSSVGGKTGINHSLGKNMIGAFYQPQKVICSIDVLASLKEREFLSGLGEAIKYGPIYDQQLFVWLEQNISAILQLEPAALGHLIQRCCEIKAAVVGSDEQEAGLRAILNFGHTFGHAIESGLGYGKWLHGEAVSAGMVMAAELSNRLGLLEQDWCARLVKLLLAAKLPIKGPALGAATYFELMQVDKKTSAGQIKYVLIKQMGQAVIASAPDELVKQIINANCCTQP